MYDAMYACTNPFPFLFLDSGQGIAWPMIPTGIAICLLAITCITRSASTLHEKGDGSVCVRVCVKEKERGRERGRDREDKND